MDETLQPDDLATESPGYWAILNQIRLPAGEFSFKNHEYQLQPMEYKGRRLCYMKATQTFGATLAETIKDIHGMMYGRYPHGVAHIFPTGDEVADFGKSYFKPLINDNPRSIGCFVKDTDTASLKKIGDAFLYLRSGRLSQKIGSTDEDTSSKTAGFAVDRVVYDEVDFMDSAVIEKYKGRMGHSLVKEEVYLGNPSHEDYGIDTIFKNSDQRYWWRKCQSCGKWTCAEKSFPKCVKTRSNGTGYIACDHCGREVLIWTGDGSGEWVPDVKDNSNYMYGYHLSTLTNFYCDPAEVLRDFENPPNNNLADVYRLRLGRAYSSESEKLKYDTVLACCGRDIMRDTDKGPCAMGVDVGIKKHVVIGIRTDNDRYTIVKVAVCDSFNQIHDLAMRFNVKSAVLDIRPYQDEVRLFQKQERFRIYLGEYRDSQIQDLNYNDKIGIVTIDRTSIFDTSHRLISRQQIRLPGQCADIEMFAKQLCNTARFAEKNKRTKQVVYRYRDTGDQRVGSHFRSSLNFFLIAAQKCRIVRETGYHKPLQRKAKHATTKI